MRDRVSGGCLNAYDYANTKRETVRQRTDGTADVFDGGGEHGRGGGGGGGGGGAATSPNPAAKQRTRKGRGVIIRDTSRAQKVKAWLVEWGRIIGDKLPEGPTQQLLIYIYPTYDVGEVHRLYSDWCGTHGLRGEYGRGRRISSTTSIPALRSGCRARRVTSRAARSASEERPPLRRRCPRTSRRSAPSTRSVLPGVAPLSRLYYCGCATDTRFHL